MRLTNKTSVTIRLLVAHIDIATQQGGEYVRAQQIKEQTGVSIAHIEGIFRLLRQNGQIIKSKRRVGYWLDEEASLYSIVRAVQVESKDELHQQESAAWDCLSLMVAEPLKNMTIGELAINGHVSKMTEVLNVA